MLELTRLACAALALSLAAPSSGSAEAPGNLQQLRSEALDLVNQSREQEGLPPLQPGTALNEAAQAHAEDMLARDYYAHVAPDGTTPADRYAAAGGSRWRLIEENIARCAECRPPVAESEAQRLHRGWMDSPGHRKNILAEGITRFGFGVAVGQQQGLYAVQTFAGPGTPASQANGDASPLSPEEQVSRGLALINEARRKEGAPPLEVSKVLVEAARSLLSDQKLKDFSPDGIEDVTQAMPAAERGDWLTLSMLSAGCGGCGAEPTAANLRSFSQRWLDSPDRRRILLDPALRQFGLAMRANGKGRQLVVALFGART
jgi:uncharacterized protein YkwD